MLDIIADRVSATGGRSLYQVPTSLDTTLVKLLHDVEEDRRAACPQCGGAALPFLAGLEFSNPRIVVLDVPAKYCEQERVFEVEEEDLARAQQRARRALRGRLSKLLPLRVGVNGQVSREIVGPAIRSRFPLDAEMSISHAEKVVLDGRTTTSIQSAGEPVALLLHTVDLPDVMSLKLEPTTRCNFGCEFCYGRHIAQGDLNAARFTEVLDHLPDLKAIELTGEGEPLLHRQLFEMLRICRDRGIFTHITTNGSLLTADSCHALLDAGVDSIAISVESLAPDRFPLLRIHGQLDTVIDGIRRIAQIRSSRSKPLTLGLWVTILRSTLKDFDRIHQFAESVGIDVISYQSLNPMRDYKRFYPEYLLKDILSPDDLRQILADESNSPELREAVAEVLRVYSGRHCDIFMHTVMSNWQGNVTPCCLLKSPAFPAFGNLTEEPFSDIWSHPEFLTYRFALQHGIIPESCRDCPDVASA